MKKTIKLAVVAALALGATSAFATNGSNLIGYGAKARGMGGTDIGISHGAESALGNGALITSVEGTEISFGGTLFMPDVQYKGNPAFSYESSAADMSVIPEVSIASKINDKFYLGVGMWGTAGMGTDYRDVTGPAGTNANGTFNMVTNLQLMQFGVPLAYKVNGLSLAITPILQYGSLDINYVYSDTTAGGPGTGPGQIGMGVAQDLQFGYNLGLSYEMKGFTIGAMYKSQIDMEYKGFSKTVNVFTGLANGYTNDKLSTPAELGVGVSYTTKGHTVALDYKNINWSSAKGYEDFEWQDQDVYSIGYEYAAAKWAVRLGYNYADSPITEQSYAGTNSANLFSTTVNMFNLLGFPAIITSHITLGGSYDLSETTSVDLAYTYAPEVTETYKTADDAGNVYDISTKHSQTSLSAQLNFKF
ncbi:OmpP1/FadL family transporter [Sulfurimonas sp.]